MFWYWLTPSNQAVVWEWDTGAIWHDMAMGLVYIANIKTETKYSSLIKKIFMNEVLALFNKRIITEMMMKGGNMPSAFTHHAIPIVFV